ncbi:formimidoylglutamase [Maribacter halichondriae]|uniref:formimidoylglutamase n=1 Tax=Maribacter halichondriae TaxID=2980554 RepID=UPI002358ECA1|nr:formimidoylglutamase [Maribacter sp. Hal144]
MPIYKTTNPDRYAGRISGQKRYLHEKVECIGFDGLVHNSSNKIFAILGYACDEGVRRNQGRIGAIHGPDAIREQLGKMANHLDDGTQLFDLGSVQCTDGNMEASQDYLSNKVGELLATNAFPILLGGGHDIAYGHFNGIKKHLGPKKSIGIINFDAHFDLRDNLKGNNSGTPFYQISQDCKQEGLPFNYLCLGIRQDANDCGLFETAEVLGVDYIEAKNFHMANAQTIVHKLLDFIGQVDHLYVTIDLDGFSSAYASGVSAPSPMGFSPTVVVESLELIINSGKMVSLDIAEMNPKYDSDTQTAKLAASLVHFVAHRV